jgi:hypothetical protein
MLNILYEFANGLLNLYEIGFIYNMQGVSPYIVYTHVNKL